MANERAALIAALALQRDWGADEALGADPVDRTRTPAPAPIRADVPSRAAVPSAPPTPPPLLLRSAALADEAATLPALRAAIAAFDGSALRDTATNLVFGEGPHGAALMLVGDAPGGEEDQAGRPFVGPWAVLLDRMLASIGIERARDCHVAHIVPWRPPGGRAPSEAEIAVFLPFLHRQIALAEPRRLVLLGGLAAKALTGSKETLSRLRGRWSQVTTSSDTAQPALATLHPANLMRTPHFKRDAWSDLLLLRRTLDEELRR